MAAMDGQHKDLALRLMDSIRAQFPNSKRADRLTVTFPPLGPQHCPLPMPAALRDDALCSPAQPSTPGCLWANPSCPARAGPAVTGVAAVHLMRPICKTLQGMYNESRGRMDDAQSWYEKIMEEQPSNQGALKRQISQVRICGTTP